MNENQKEYVVTQIIKNKIESKKMHLNSHIWAVYTGLMTIASLLHLSGFNIDSIEYIDNSRMIILLPSVGASMYGFAKTIKSLADKSGLDYSTKALEQLLEASKLEEGKSK